MTDQYSFLSESLFYLEETTKANQINTYERTLGKKAPPMNPNETNEQYINRLKKEVKASKRNNPSGSKPNPTGTKDYKKATNDTKRARAAEDAALARKDQAARTARTAASRKDVESAFAKGNKVADAYQKRGERIAGAAERAASDKKEAIEKSARKLAKKKESEAKRLADKAKGEAAKKANLAKGKAEHEAAEKARPLTKKIKKAVKGVVYPAGRHIARNKGKYAAGAAAAGLGGYGIYKWAKNKKAASKKD